MTFDLAGPDRRPALVCDDVQDLELANFRALGNTQTGVVRLVNTRRGYIHGCRALNEASQFASVEGTVSQELLFQANDLRRCAQPVCLADGAEAGAITIS